MNSRVKKNGTARLRSMVRSQLAWVISSAGSRRLIPAALTTIATGPHEMDLPGFRLYLLKGKSKGYFSVWVSGNWRGTFRFEGIDAVDVDNVDYH